MKFTFFRTQRPRQFRHIPIYYDERQEQFEEMKRRAGVDTHEGEVKEGEPQKHKYVKGELKARWTINRTDMVKEESRKKNIRLIVIIGVLLYIAYRILTMNTQILEVFFKK